ncbi:hypothetical protein A3SAC12_0047 [Lactobacillus phage 3-SAC12]|nr:hypothetical protein A3SAC12_0047 [Lactobacillus phage 3-SAC12]
MGLLDEINNRINNVNLNQTAPAGLYKGSLTFAGEVERKGYDIFEMGFRVSGVEEHNKDISGKLTANAFISDDQQKTDRSLSFLIAPIYQAGIIDSQMVENIQNNLDGFGKFIMKNADDWDWTLSVSDDEYKGKKRKNIMIVEVSPKSSDEGSSDNVQENQSSPF